MLLIDYFNDILNMDFLMQSQAMIFVIIIWYSYYMKTNIVIHHKCKMCVIVTTSNSYSGLDQ